MPPADRAVVLVKGQRELFRAFAKADREARLFVRHEFRNVAKPVAADVEQLAVNRIRNMPKSPKWARQRIGVSQKLVYVAPRQKGTHGRGRARRPNLADLLISRAMQPALERNRAGIRRNVERAFDRISDHFNQGGVRL
jgi:hypothetical protein